VRRVHFGDIIWTTATRLEVNALDLRDPTQLDTQPQAHQDRASGFTHGPHVSHLTEIRIGPHVRVFAAAFRGLPEPVTQVEDLIVLCVLRVFREGQAFGVVSDNSGQVLVHQVF